MHPIARLRRWLRHIPGRIVEADARNRDERRLATVPDHLLFDIGLSRDDVRSPGFTRRR